MYALSRSRTDVRCHFPYLNEAAEDSWPLNRQSKEKIRLLSRQKRIHGYEIVKHFLDQFCITSPGQTWILGKDIELPECSHRGLR